MIILSLVCAAGDRFIKLITLRRCQ